MIDFKCFEAVTFDCYGTLIDWESGIQRALGALLGHHGQGFNDEILLELFGRFESAAERGPFRAYRDVLEDVAFKIGEEVGATVTGPKAAAFASSVATWLPFPDTVDALRVLEARFRLAVVSNVDDDLFATSLTQLEVDFETIVTAQQLRSYKPAPAHFHEVVARLNLPIDRILHVAQSLHHDIVPASALGFTCVWVNRRGDRVGAGATPPADASPALEVTDLAHLAGLLA
jgi:2-haloacid dehalogenase